MVFVDSIQMYIAKLFKDYDELISDLMKKFDEMEYIHLGSGEYRKVYALSSNLVLKIPLDVEGIICNFTELIRYLRNKNTDIAKHMARCNLIFLNGVPCVVMERLFNTDMAIDMSEQLRELGFKADSCVQIVRLGDVDVCYDYGNEYIDLYLKEVDMKNIERSRNNTMSPDNINVKKLETLVFSNKKTKSIKIIEKR